MNMKDNCEEAGRQGVGAWTARQGRAREKTAGDVHAQATQPRPRPEVGINTLIIHYQDPAITTEPESEIQSPRDSCRRVRVQPGRMTGELTTFKTYSTFGSLTGTKFSLPSMFSGV